MSVRNLPDVKLLVETKGKVTILKDNTGMHQNWQAAILVLEVHSKGINKQMLKDKWTKMLLSLFSKSKTPWII